MPLGVTNLAKVHFQVNGLIHFVPAWEKIAIATGLTGTALTVYLIISEGSRIFPPRNLIPIP